MQDHLDTSLSPADTLYSESKSGQLCPSRKCAPPLTSHGNVHWKGLHFLQNLLDGVKSLTTRRGQLPAMVAHNPGAHQRYLADIAADSAYEQTYIGELSHIRLR